MTKKIMANGNIFTESGSGLTVIGKLLAVNVYRIR